MGSKVILFLNYTKISSIVCELSDFFALLPWNISEGGVVYTRADYLEKCKLTTDVLSKFMFHILNFQCPNSLNTIQITRKYCKLEIEKFTMRSRYISVYGRSYTDIVQIICEDDLSDEKWENRGRGYTTDFRAMRNLFYLYHGISL